VGVYAIPEKESLPFFLSAHGVDVWAFDFRGEVSFYFDFNSDINLHLVLDNDEYLRHYF
jgi:hypothetical protein